MVLPYVDEENLWTFDHKNDKKRFWEEGSREESKR